MFILATGVVWVIHVLLVLLTVAFFTLFERKVMGLIHLRVGPVNVSFAGLLQPLLDAFKLLTKQSIVSLRSNKFVYSSSPMFSLFLSLCFWILLPGGVLVCTSSLSLLGFMFLGSVIVVANLLSGWSSNSKYAFIGSLRSVAQSVSYEAVFTTLVLCVLIVGVSYSVYSLGEGLGVVGIVLLPIWIISTLAETHRAPFDFSESESELVSGYNTEYSGGLFAFVFLSEYSALLFSCGVIYFVFFVSARSLSFLMLPWVVSAFILLLSFVFVVIRVTYCRYRYDFLIIIAWKSLLPVTLVCLLLSFVF